MKKSNLVIGYTTGVFDMFHIGHLNILKRAKSFCDKLIVGVTTDDFMKKYKNKQPVIPFNQRMEIVQSIKYVDLAIPQNNHDKFDAYKRLKFDIILVGDDWFGTQKWNQFEKEFESTNVKFIYLDRTENISSSKLRNKL